MHNLHNTTVALLTSLPAFIAAGIVAALMAAASDLPPLASLVF